MKKPLFIYGAGGLGREILSMVQALDEWEVKGFFDDGNDSETIKGIRVLGGIKATKDLDADSHIVFAVGDPVAKKSLISRIKKPFLTPTLIHPSAVIQDTTSVNIGPGCLICAGVRITCDIRIGGHVLLNLNCTVGHDTSIGSFSSIMPGVNIAGEVTIGECVLLGSGCNIRNRVNVANTSRVGMGAVVLQDVSYGQTVAGVPARVLK
jgi:sugar O-acyltransferase (sialic acid O-acetyltransferase NeuD family)